MSISYIPALTPVFTASGISSANCGFGIYVGFGRFSSLQRIRILSRAQLNLGLIYRMACEGAKVRTCFEAFLAKAQPTQYGEMIPKVRDALSELREVRVG
jgi:hypothetical protein